VRSLERAIGGVVRYKAVEWAEYLDSTAADDDSAINAAAASASVSAAPEACAGAVIPANLGLGAKKVYERVVQEDQLEAILGISRWDGEEREREERRGVVYGLVVMGQGEGGILPVETIALPGSGRLKLTGSLGDVSIRLIFGIWRRCVDADCLVHFHRLSRRAENSL
jgi:ATP-dependent Lon protease